MGWFSSFIAAVIAAAACCVAAFFLAEKCVTWYHLGGPNSGAGYFVVAMAIVGLIGGFFIGFTVAKVFGTDFFQGTGLALAAVAGVLGNIYLLARLGGEIPPEINGDTMQVMVEMRMAPGWKPSNRALAGENGCTLRARGRFSWGQPRHGDLEFKRTAVRDGRWVVPCEVHLHSNREERLFDMYLGRKTSLAFQLPLPANPEPKHEQWTEWTSTGFSHFVDQPPVTGYEYRVRVRRSKAAYEESLARGKAEREERQRAAAALNETTPIKEWLRLATDGKGDSVNGEVGRKLEERIGSVGEALPDEDPQVVYQALEFLRFTNPTPQGLNPAIEEAGRKVLPLVAKAKMATDPDDPDLNSEKLARQLGFVWIQVLEKRGLPADSIKAEIREAAAYAKKGEISELASSMR